MNKDKRPYADFVYNINTLNAIFAVSSVALVLCVVWMIWDDYDREWKNLQREANALEVYRTEVALQAAQQDVDPEQLQQVEAEIEAVEGFIRTQQDRYDSARSALEKLDADWYVADQNLRFAKAEYDVIKYEYEEAVRSGHEKKAAEKKGVLGAMAGRIDALRLANQEVERKQAVQKQVVDEVTGRRKELERQREALLWNASLLRRKLEKIEPSFPNRFRNMPMVDFIDPSINVRQVVLGDVKSDMNFTQVPKVDRCTTCHVNIDRSGYEVDPETGRFRDAALRGYIEENYPEEERPGRTAVFASHPDLDLYMGSASPHPIDRVGCTVCHLGRDRGTTFVKAAHTPGDGDEARRWQEQYGWHRMHYWDDPMLPIQYVESSCAQCHGGVNKVPKADRLNRGIHLVKTLGCQGCHKIEGYEDLRKVGPDLRKVAAKLDRDWAAKWIRDPKGFRPTTTMPRNFDLINVRSPGDLARSTAAIHGVVTYLFEKSEQPAYPDPPVAGDPGRGEALVAKVGCRGCHVVGAEDTLDQDYGRRNFGPNLNAISDKVEAGWLYAWLKDPKAYFPDTRMPDLRLTEREAADITAYLLTLRNPDFEDRKFAEMDPAVRDELAVEYLRTRLPDALAREKLNGMSEQERDLYLGERIISRQGCFGCHLIPGFEETLSIGTELTEEGSKDLTRLDFGLNPLDIPHTRHDWFFTKLKQPRVFDLLGPQDGREENVRVKKYDEKLRMPNFGLSDGDAHAITTALLSFRKSSVAPAAKRQLSPHEIEIEKGRRLVYEDNCRGCHVVEGEGGAIREILMGTYIAEQGISEAEAAGFTPPILNHEGGKVQPDWLFSFLKEPGSIRPWLDVRMPTFGFEDQKAIDITTYFSRLEGQQFPYRTSVDKRMSQKEIHASQILFSEDIFNCWTCHQQGDIPPKGDPSSWAPDLTLARERLKPEWIERWLQDPQKVQTGTKMPTFFDDEMTYLPEGLAEYFKLPDGTRPEDGVIVLPSAQVIRMLTDYIVHGLHQDTRLTRR